MRIELACFAAWIVPAVAGAGVWSALRQARVAAHEWIAALGAGWLIGVLAAAGIAGVVSTDDTRQTFMHAWPWLAALGVVGWIIAALVRSRWPGGAATASIPLPRGATPRALQVISIVLVILIVARVLMIGDEAVLRPLFPWDAWSAWAMKPKAWFLDGRAVPFVSMRDWLARPDDMLRTNAAWAYPELLAWIELWFASAAGMWNEPLIDLAWCGALVAFSLAAFGYWRSYGLPAWLAIVLVYAFVSLPLVDAHVALAGYADLWLSLVLGLAVLAWTRWLLLREPGQWLLAVALALTLPAIKLEGAVWALILSAAVVFERIPRLWRPRIALAAAALALAGILLGGFVLPMLGLGLVHVSWGQVDIPVVGRFDLAWHSVGRSMLASLFTLPNWHLLWYALPILAILRWRRFVEDRAARLLGLLVLLDLSFLFVLFFFTAASAWARDYTSANRLIMHIVPSVFVLMAVLLRPDVRFSGARIGTARGSRLPISRA